VAAAFGDPHRNSNGNCAMKKIVLLIIALTLNFSALSSASQTPVGTPAQQYSTLLKEYGPVSGGMRTATTDLQRKQSVERLSAFSTKFLDLADKYPDDPVALKALRQAIQVDVSADSAAQNAWEMNESEFPAGSIEGAAGKAVALVLRDHVLSKQLAPIVDRMRYGYRKDYEEGLAAVLEKNPHRDVQALSCLALAQFLGDRLRMLNLSDDRAELETCFDIVFGKKYLPEWRRRDRAKLEEQIEALFERAASEYGDVKFRGSTVGETAKSELYAIRNLGVGKVSPDIVGKDQNGTPFKLSDYRGKVVLLYFWSEF
jgi:hypothetical protein